MLSGFLLVFSTIVYIPIRFLHLLLLSFKQSFLFQYLYCNIYREQKIEVEFNLCYNMIFIIKQIVQLWIQIALILLSDSQVNNFSSFDFYCRKNIFSYNYLQLQWKTNEIKIIISKISIKYLLPLFLLHGIIDIQKEDKYYVAQEMNTNIRQRQNIYLCSFLMIVK